MFTFFFKLFLFSVLYIVEESETGVESTKIQKIDQEINK